MNKKCKAKIARMMAICLMLGAMFANLGCGESTNKKQEANDSGIIQIGMTFDSFVIERWQRERDVFIASVNELGAEVNVQNANGDINEQIKQIEYFMEKGVDVIVVVQVADENQDLAQVIKKAHDAGIYVIAYDRLILNANVDLYISFDNVEVGRLMGEHMANHVGAGGNIVQVCGPLSDYNVTLVQQGFMTEISNANITVVSRRNIDNWTAEMAFDYTSNYLSNNTSPQGFMCGNDSLAGNCVRALSELRLAGEVCVVGQDADLDACQRIVEGTQCMTVYKPVENMAKRAAELAVKLARDGELTDVTNTMNDGTYDVPYEAMNPIAVTKENMDSVIIGSGYHNEADVYLNVQ